MHADKINNMYNIIIIINYMSLCRGSVVVGVNQVRTQSRKRAPVKNRGFEFN